MSASETAIVQFVDAVRDYCAWLEGDRYDDPTERYTALVYLSSMYSAALRLPDLSDKSLPRTEKRIELDENLTQKVMDRLGQFPNRFYSRVESTPDGKTETFQDDLGRDLYVTYTSVKRGLLDFEAGFRDFALWSWQFTFWLDWGGHSTNAMQSLHAQIHDELNREE